MNPAMIDPHKTEFFLYKGALRLIHKGKMSRFEDAPLSALDLLQTALDNDPKAQQGLILLGITEPIAQLRKYAECRYGSLDEVADFGSKNTDDEMIDCPNKFSCKAYGLVCKRKFSIKGETLSSREVNIGRLYSTGKKVEDIAKDLFIEPITVWSTLLNIKIKLQLPNHIAVAGFFQRNIAQ